MKLYDLFSGIGLYRNKSYLILLTKRKCRWCNIEFEITELRDDGKLKGANRQYCCYNHSKLANWHKIKDWRKENPEKILEYRKKRYNPKEYKIEANKKRKKILEILGNKCKICNHSNPLHLQAHYIPTINGYGWRHPRNPSFISKNKNDFVMLCANHHQELTITGKIEEGGGVIATNIL